MQYQILTVGNPNSGKTTLFNTTDWCKTTSWVTGLV